MVRTLLAVLSFAALAGCDDIAGSDTAYTLYRSSVTGPMRIHIATFDAAQKAEYNDENCRIAAGLFQAQPGVLVRYWCEKGRYKK
ncbi:hypothetical protein [Mesorhizobium sp. M8A.F.Ca.ET.165.01.1.1]|uniref:hypothetical protein n=1 Tax=Mesorhizobium sp. M8A.F.Ca.ET.165.01.1.1 TaxID=2563960 RepID=UPI0010937254|nr:hypothetical protein [Mesorhizobium sp. M8A.F.Ca.ET.165.01.1.1]TGT36207.1 hypothetical protein EN808_29930 [Mesorhizobium sp. M8A.F.Ca.ET.165.01.1.1]